MSLLVLLLVFVIGLIVGAYSHKWLAKVTGAPANLTVANAAGAAKTAVKDVAQKV